jgi:hypothetical protein
VLSLTHEEKIDMMRTLNWDYDVSPEDMLAVIEGRLEAASPFDRKRLMVRSLERLSWHCLVALWGGVEPFKELYTPELARRLWPKSRRREFDFAIAVLRGEPVPATRWGDGYYQSLRNRFFSDRRDSAQ